MAINVLVADKFEKVGLEGLKALGCAVTNLPEAGATNLAGAIKEHGPQVLIVRSSKTPRAALEASPALKGVIRAGAGYDNIDLPAATERGIAVCNT
ncbi:MAG: hydroxyacid dehydrogenase, partial [Phycisphaerales bacterium]